MTSDPAQEVEDLRASILDFAAGGYAVDRVIVSRCAECDSEAFHLVFDEEAGVAARICAECEAELGLADSEEHIDEADAVVQAECRCGHEVFRVATGFALDQDGEVRWVSVGLRCIRDGLAGVYVDWKIDYRPTAQLLENA